MDISVLFGQYWWTQFLFFAALIMVVSDIVATMFTIFYHRVMYPKILRPKYDRTFKPFCSVVLPCKNLPKDFESNVLKFLDQKYDSYELLFVVESEQDLAYPVLQQIAQNNPRASVVVAGLSTTCAQKNKNLLEALKKAAPHSELYVFADCDIGPNSNWLSELILPLSNPKVTVTTGFRGLYLPKAKVGELGHYYINIWLYIMFTVACAVGGVGLWGGSMAMRREDFERLGVAQRWDETVVDDMSLSQIAMKNSLRVVFVSNCVTTTDDLLMTVRDGVSWFERQIMFLKAYQKPLWFMTGPICFLWTFLIAWLPIALGISLTSSTLSFWQIGGAAPLVLYIGSVLSLIQYPWAGQVPGFRKLLLLQPMFKFTHGLAYYRTVRKKRIVWAGITYHLGRRGKVVKIER